jgi:hypothetical protein
MTSLHFFRFLRSLPVSAFDGSRFDFKVKCLRKWGIITLKLNFKNNWIILIIIHILIVPHLSSLYVTLLLNQWLLLLFICFGQSLVASSMIFFLVHWLCLVFVFLHVLITFNLGWFIYIFQRILVKLSDFYILRWLIEVTSNLNLLIWETWCLKLFYFLTYKLIIILIFYLIIRWQKVKLI